VFVTAAVELVFVTAAMELAFVTAAVELVSSMESVFVSKVAVLKVALFEAALVFASAVEPPLLQVAIPVGSRPQVAPGGQQKVSPAHAICVGSTHPAMVVQVLPTAQQPMLALVAVKQVKPDGQHVPLEQHSPPDGQQNLASHGMLPAEQQVPGPQVAPAGQHWEPSGQGT